MKKILLFALAVVCLSLSPGFGQKSPRKKKKKDQQTTAADTLAPNPIPVWAPKKGRYNPSATVLFDLLHTRLEASFDWKLRRLHGKATLRLKPHFFPQETLELDAVGFLIHEISLQGQQLSFDYDSSKLFIRLPKTYTRQDSFEVVIRYTARPDEIASSGSAAIGDDKGLYFINPDGKIPHKPRQIWTQGETQANSCWLPTIDAPNVKSRQEMILTVENQFQTLSNGRLIASRQNPDGTRTDHWLMDKPHSIYLFMMVIGQYEVVKDTWRGKEVSYWVEPAYKPYAKAIFGRTPLMLEFFSTLLDYPYPWDKYAQVVVRDYVSGAMENTTASIFMEDVQVDNRFLLDDNWDQIIAHELFHHWFGDLVTCESWANLPLNESFANYAEYLWAEYYYGEEQAQMVLIEEAQNYLNESQRKREPMIRYYYTDKEDMFDSHSYAKGCLILHLLRSYVGDEAFFASLALYLKQKQYKTAEIHDLRMAFEEITGNDMNWFFDQFFLSAGHPELKITDSYSNGKLTVIVEQKQDLRFTPLYKIPVYLDVYAKNMRSSLRLMLSQQMDTFIIEMPQKPDLVHFNPDYTLFGEIEHEKNTSQLIFQYQNARRFRMAYEALERLAPKVADPQVLPVVTAALSHSSKFLRELAASALAALPAGLRSAALKSKLREMAFADSAGVVRAAALATLQQWALLDEADLQLALADSSYKVAAVALNHYLEIGAAKEAVIEKFENIANQDILLTLANHFIESKVPNKNHWFESAAAQLGGYKTASVISFYGYYNFLVDECDHNRAIAFFLDHAQGQYNAYVKTAAWYSLVIYANKTNDQALMETARQILQKEPNQKTRQQMIESLQR